MYLPGDPKTSPPQNTAGLVRRRQSFFASYAFGCALSRFVTNRDPNHPPTPRRPVEGSRPKLLARTAGWIDHDLAHPFVPTAPKGWNRRDDRFSTHGLLKLRILILATRDYYDPGTTGGDITMWEFGRYLASVGHS